MDEDRETYIQIPAKRSDYQLMVLNKSADLSGLLTVKGGLSLQS